MTQLRGRRTWLQMPSVEYRERVAVRVAVGIRDEIRLDAGLLARGKPVATVENRTRRVKYRARRPRAFKSPQGSLALKEGRYS